MGWLYKISDVVRADGADACDMHLQADGFPHCAVTLRLSCAVGTVPCAQNVICTSVTPELPGIAVLIPRDLQAWTAKTAADHILAHRQGRHSLPGDPPIGAA